MIYRIAMTFSDLESHLGYCLLFQTQYVAQLSIYQLEYSVTDESYTWAVIMPDLGRRGHYEMMAGVCMSVCLSVCRVPRPNSTTERLRKPKIGRMDWKPITRVTCELIQRSKCQRSRSPCRLLLSQTMRHTQVGGNSRDTKVKVKAYSVK